MLKEGHTLRLDGPIHPALGSLFLFSIGTDSFGSNGGGFDTFGFVDRSVDTAFGSIGGGDDASSSGWRDIDDSSTGGGGSYMS